MKFLSTLILAAGLATALPAAAPSPADDGVAALEARQSGSTRNDLESGSSANCPRAIFIFARATGEIGNIVRVPSLPPSPPSPHTPGG